MAYLEYHPGDPSAGKEAFVSVIGIDEHDKNQKHFSLISLAIESHMGDAEDVTTEDVKALMHTEPQALPATVIKKILEHIDEPPIIIAPHGLVADHITIDADPEDESVIEPFVEPLDAAVIDQFEGDLAYHVAALAHKYKYTHAAFQTQVIETETGHEIIEHRSLGVFNDKGEYEPQCTVLPEAYLQEGKQQQLSELESLFQLQAR